MKFSEMPGMRERHLIRKINNPLFNNCHITDSEIKYAQKQDAEEIDLFMGEFRSLVQRAVDFDEQADPDVVLKLKERLDQCYEKAASLAGDQSEIKEMLSRLIKAIMQAVWKGIGNDFVAKSKLETEENAREMHFALLEHKIIADMIRPDSVINEEELASSLMSENEVAITAAMQLFSLEQQAMIYKTAAEKINKIDINHPVRSALENKLRVMEKVLNVSNIMPL